jgi:hypothetical protein
VTEPRTRRWRERVKLKYGMEWIEYGETSGCWKLESGDGIIWNVHRNGMAASVSAMSQREARIFTHTRRHRDGSVVVVSGKHQTTFAVL